MELNEETNWREWDEEREGERDGEKKEIEGKEMELRKWKKDNRIFDTCSLLFHSKFMRGRERRKRETSCDCYSPQDQCILLPEDGWNKLVLDTGTKILGGIYIGWLRGRTFWTLDCSYFYYRFKRGKRTNKEEERWKSCLIGKERKEARIEDWFVRSWFRNERRKRWVEKPEGERESNR